MSGKKSHQKFPFCPHAPFALVSPSTAARRSEGKLAKKIQLVRQVFLNRFRLQAKEISMLDLGEKLIQNARLVTKRR